MTLQASNCTSIPVCLNAQYIHYLVVILSTMLVYTEIAIQNVLRCAQVNPIQFTSSVSVYYNF